MELTKRLWQVYAEEKLLQKMFIINKETGNLILSKGEPGK